jgi:hypothetical protein
VLNVNNPNYKKKIFKSYNGLKSINIFKDFKRLFQLFMSLYFLKKPKLFGNLIWYFFYGTRIFRKSNTGNILYTKKMGPLTRKFFLYLFPRFKKLYKRTNKNYSFLINHINNLKLKCPLISKKEEFIVTPRIPLLIKNKERVIQIANKMNIEIGDWFNECPPKLNIEKSYIHSSKISHLISNKIINIPCYFSLGKNEILQLKKFISAIALVEKK